MPKPTRLVIIGGCGHVGLPLGIVFANCGINVVLLDVSAERIATVNSGRTPFMENAEAEHLRAVIGKTLLATSDSSCLKTADAAIAAVGTPVDEHLNPTVTELYRNIDITIDILPEGALLVLRSRQVVKVPLPQKPVLKLGRLQAGYSGFRKGLNSEMVEQIFRPALWLKKGSGL
jgi:UDP-N-acetyl-D-mannosaminuronic acid dehydrogenase